MFRRGGNTPKMSHFFGRTNSVSSVPEEDEDAGNEADSDDSSSLSSEGGRRHSSGSSLVESLSAEEAEKLASCLDYILDIVGEAIPEIQGMFFFCNNESSRLDFETVGARIASYVLNTPRCTLMVTKFDQNCGC